MAKGKNDLILRDRLRIGLQASGDQTVVYGRFDLSDYVNAVEKKGLALKEVRMQMRNPDNFGGIGFDNTGIAPTCAVPNINGAVLFNPASGGAGRELNSWAGLKLFATTRAYESAQDVGIASPDVYHVEEFWTLSQNASFRDNEPTGDSGAGVANVVCGHNIYGTPDLHPDGATIITDLLVGLAADKWEWGDLTGELTLEIDVMLIAESITVTQSRMNELIVQSQDL